MVSQATIQPGIAAQAHSLGQRVMFRLAEVPRTYGRPALPGRLSHQAAVAQGPNWNPASRNRPGRVSCPQAGEPVGKSWIPRSSDTTARPVSDGNLSTAGRDKMDIARLGKPLRRLTLAFAIVSAILPAIFLGLLGFTVLTGSEYWVGPKELFVVSVSGGLSVFLFATYTLIQKTRRVGTIIAIFVCSIMITYIGYKIFVNIILRI